MANTIRAAKNTFGGGLVMDLAPDTTPNEVLTSALNATLVTFNGNELQLQNDMGNGRVETARLPEGYIPVGTCEFGDIIYIVSYNPLTNKSQIGCFPSPERNISSDEIGSTGQMLSASDFQNGTVNGGEFVPNGELKANSVKKILYNNKLNPGDKFIIYDTQEAIVTNNASTITDIGNTSHDYGAWPKLLRIHVIAIEDGGKINYLDSTVKWYNNVNYFIQQTSENQNGPTKIDIDAYRDKLNSGYSVFQSKISGKLALLIELEKITSFDCTYSIYGGEKTTEVGESDGDGQGCDITYKTYKIFWNIGWSTTDPNVNPMAIVLTKSKFVGRQSEESEGSSEKVGYRLWEDDNTYTNGKKLSTTYQILSNIPKAFSTEADADYWFAYISPHSDSAQTLYGGSYASFQATDSYDARLKKFLNGVDGNGNVVDPTLGILGKSQYSDQTLSKLNAYIDDNHYPVPGKYYINATQIIRQKGEDPNTHQDVYIDKIYTQSTKDGELKEIDSVDIDDIIVNNYFHHSVYKTFDEENFKIPIIQTFRKRVDEDIITIPITPDLSSLIYNYEITPAMPYGLLREYSVEGYIDFSKIGTGAIDLTAYKYFVGENAVNLTLGLDAYVEDNKGIDEICIEFYDNQGLAASYHIMNKDSYSGQFSEVIPLNGVTNTFKLQDTDFLGASHLHMGLEANEGDANLVKWDESNLKVVKADEYESGVTHLNDCGTLYSNMLYLLKIIVKYCPKDALGDLDPSQTEEFKTYYRWMYTTPIFNDYYFQVTDFDNIDLNLILDIVAQYTFNNGYYYKSFAYVSDNNGNILKDSADLYKYLSARVQLITSTKNVTVHNDDENPGGGDDPGGGGSGDNEDTEPLRMWEPTVSTTQFTIVFNKTISEINNAGIVFTCTKDGVTRTLEEDTDYEIVSGVGSSVFTIEFDDIGSTYSMEVTIPAGTIKLGEEKQFENEAISFNYAFNNGQIQS